MASIQNSESVNDAAAGVLPPTIWEDGMLG